jgi:hypothetical protein
MLDFASCIYKSSVFFGSYPREEWLSLLLDEKIRYIVDATSFDERIKYNLFDYKTILTEKNCSCIEFPIEDNNIPCDIVKFRQFIYDLAVKINSLHDNEKMYIHCKGGHGRSGLISACLLCYLCNISPEKALCLTTQAHATRTDLKPKWKNARCPQTYRQRKFVIDVFRPVIITRDVFHHKIANHLITFLNETNIRPIKEKSETKVLSHVILHLRKINKYLGLKNEPIFLFP